MKKLELVKNSYSIIKQGEKMENDSMGNSEIAEIIVQFTQDSFNDDLYSDFFDDNDLGVPMAIAVVQDMVVLKDGGEKVLQETYKDLCLRFEADPNRYYSDIDELIHWPDGHEDDE